jgi:hypothetical protein
MTGFFAPAGGTEGPDISSKQAVEFIPFARGRGRRDVAHFSCG